MTDMVYLDDHSDVAEYLDTLGWDTRTASTSDLFAANRLAPRAENDDDRAPFALAAYISATLKVGFQGAHGRWGSPTLSVAPDKDLPCALRPKDSPTPAIW
jgi:hypothetical protein